MHPPIGKTVEIDVGAEMTTFEMELQAVGLGVGMVRKEVVELSLMIPKWNWMDHPGLVEVKEMAKEATGFYIPPGVWETIPEQIRRGLIRKVKGEP
jgi:hypothetical protein